MSIYSAGMMSVPFLFVETQNTVCLLAEGLSLAEAKEQVHQNNAYQMQGGYRAERSFNANNKRPLFLCQFSIRAFLQQALLENRSVLVVLNEIVSVRANVCATSIVTGIA